MKDKMINIRKLDNRKVNIFGFSALVFFITKGFFLGSVSTVILSLSKQWTIFSMIFGFFLSLIILFLVLWIANYRPELDLSGKIISLFGRYIGGVINIIIAIITFIALNLLLFNLTKYLSIKYLTNTPDYLLAFLFIAIAIYGISKGAETISRTAFIIFILDIFIIALIVISLASYMDLDNFKPFTPYPVADIFKGSLYYLSYITTPLFLLLSIPKNKIISNDKYNKYFVISFCFAVIAMIIAIFYVISTLGIELASLFQYPEYVGLKKIRFFNSIRNVENLFSVSWIFDVVFIIIMCLYSIKNNIKTTFRIRSIKINNVILWVVGLISTFSFHKFIINDYDKIKFMESSFITHLTIPILSILALVCIVIYSKKLVKKKL